MFFSYYEKNILKYQLIVKIIVSIVFYKPMSFNHLTTSLHKLTWIKEINILLHGEK